MTIFKFALLRGLRNPLSLVFNCILPVLLILISPFWTAENAMGSLYMLMIFMYGSFLIARGILNDKLDGTIFRILAAPVSTFEYLLQNLLACMTPLTIQVIIVCILGNFLYDWSLTITLSLALCYTVFAVASVTFSFAWSCLFKNKEISYAIFSVLMSIVALISGLWIPVSVLPQAIRYAGALFPSYWASNAVEILLTGGSMLEYWLSLLTVLFFALGYLLYGGKRRII